MRTHGPGHDVTALGCHDHACVAYSDTAELLHHVTPFLREGLARGERLLYVQDASPVQMREHLAGVGPVDDLVRAGMLELVSLADVYTPGGLDVEGQRAYYHHAIDRALADGFTGLRAVADGTSVLVRAADPDTIVRWEAAADRIIADRPMTGLCCYHRPSVPPATLDQVTAAHPVACGAGVPSPFHVFSEPGARVALSGDLDAFAVAGFERLLDLVGPDEPFELDLSALDFVDHEGVLAIMRRAAAGSGMTITGAPYVYTRVAELIGVQP